MKVLENIIKYIELFIISPTFQIFIPLILIVVLLFYAIYIKKIRENNKNIVDKLKEQGKDYIKNCVDLNELKKIKAYSYKMICFIALFELFIGSISLIFLLTLLELIINIGQLKNFTKLINYIKEVKSGYITILMIWCLKKPLKLVFKIILTLKSKKGDLVYVINELKNSEDYFNFIDLAKAKIKEIK